MANKKNAIILLSGGLDSSVTSFYIKKKLKAKKIVALFFNYGQRMIKEERYCSHKIANLIKAKFIEIKIPWLKALSTSLINSNKKLQKTQESSLSKIKEGKKEIIKYWVPARNTIFISIALALAENLFLKNKGVYNIYTGFKNEGKIQMKDSTKDFLNVINLLIKHATHYGIYKVISPIINYDKDEVIDIGAKLNIPFEYTYSCYSNNGFSRVYNDTKKSNKGTKKAKKLIPIHCGTCYNCMLRKKAFYWANIKDHSIYLK